MSDEARAGIIWIFVVVIAVFAPLFANEVILMENIFQFASDAYADLSSNIYVVNLFVVFSALFSIYLLKKTGQGVKKGVKWVFTPKPISQPGEFCRLLLKDLQGDCEFGSNFQKVVTRNFHFHIPQNTRGRVSVFVNVDGKEISSQMDLEYLLSDAERILTRKTLDALVANGEKAREARIIKEIQTSILPVYNNGGTCSFCCSCSVCIGGQK